jgi:hypothetical protein
MKKETGEEKLKRILKRTLKELHEAEKEKKPVESEPSKNDALVYVFKGYLGKMVCPRCEEFGFAELGEIVGVKIVHILHKQYDPARRFESCKGTVTLGGHYASAEEVEKLNTSIVLKLEEPTK